jgi:hypothetical protein
LFVEPLEDRALPSVTALSLAYPPGGPSLTANGDSFAPSMSADGRFIAFVSQGTNLVAGQTDTNSALDVFLYDRTMGTTTLVSHASGSATTTADDASFSPVISADGHFVAFVSLATNLVAGQTDGNSADDVFLYDRVSGMTTLVSAISTSSTTTGNAASFSPVMSAEGNFIAFVSGATNLVSGQTDANGGDDVFLFDRLALTTTLVSHIPGTTTTTGDKPSLSPAINSDGSFVAFVSQADNLVTGQSEGNTGDDVFLFDRTAGTVILVSHNNVSNTTTGNNISDTPAISADGNFIAFGSLATNLINGQVDNNGGEDVFLYGRVAGTIALVSHIPGAGATTGNSISATPVINADGSFVAFESLATNLVSGQTDTNAVIDVFLYQRSTATIILVSHATASATTTGNGGADQSVLSADGRFIAFESLATNLVSGQTNGTLNNNVFLYDRLSGTIALVSHINGSTTITGNNTSDNPVINGTGKFVAFTSTASNLLAADNNNHQDVFGFDRIDDLVGHVQGSGQWWVGVSNGSSAFAPAEWDSWNPNVTWVDVQTGDFTGDGHDDIVGRVLQSGEWWVAVSNGSNGFTTSRWAVWSPNVTWVDVKVGDFDGDGKMDIVGRVLRSGEWWVGASTGSSFTTSKWATWSTSVTWADVQVGDFDGDGKADIAGRALQSGEWWVGLSSGSSFTASKWATWSPAVTWVDVRVGDFNGDGKADITGRVLQSGEWWTGLSSGSNFNTTRWAIWSPNVTWVDVRVGDFDGDGISDDIAGRVLQTGEWWVALSNGSTGFTSSKWDTWSPNVTWVDVQVGDFNGDGMQDISGRVLQSGEWWTGVSTGTSFNTSLWDTWNSSVTWASLLHGDYA